MNMDMNILIDVQCVSKVSLLRTDLAPSPVFVSRRRNIANMTDAMGKFYMFPESMLTPIIMIKQASSTATCSAGKCITSVCNQINMKCVTA